MLDASSSASDSSSLTTEPYSSSAYSLEQSEPTLRPPRHEVAPDRDAIDRPPSKCQTLRFKPWQYIQPKVRQPYLLQRFDHTAPISALRDRDLSALSALFDRYAMPDLEADIDRVLTLLPPEPCWEDEDLAFIKHASAAES